MAFLVEDGTGLALANSYVSVAEFATYCGDVGFVLTAYSNAQQEQALVRATRAVDARGLRAFVGTKNTGTQGLAWPRTDAVDVYGFDLVTTAVPKYVKEACVLGAMAELQSVGTLQETLSRGGQVQEERVEGAVTVRYFAGAPVGTVYRAFLDALSPVLSSGGSSGNIRLLRA